MVALVIGVSVAIGLLLSSGVPKSASPGRLSTYTDRAFGFAITYDPGLICVASGSHGSPPGTEMSAANFVDDDPGDTPYPASMIGPSPSPGAAPHGELMVFVQKMSARPRLSLAEATEYLNDNPAAGPTGAPGFHPGGVSPVTLNGLSGYEGTYRWNQGRNLSYLLSKDDYVYYLALTYANATRPANKVALLAALHSFRVVSNPTTGSATTGSIPGYSSKRYDVQAIAYPDADRAWAAADIWGRDQWGDAGVMGGAILSAKSGAPDWRRQQAGSGWYWPSEIAFANDRCGWVLGSWGMPHHLCSPRQTVVRPGSCRT